MEERKSERQKNLRECEKYKIVYTPKPLIDAAHALMIQLKAEQDAARKQQK